MKSGIIEHKLKMMASGMAGRLAGAQRRILFVVLMLAALAVTSLDLAPLQSVRAQQAGTWTTKTPMPMARQHLAAAAINGKLYAVGGDEGVSVDTLQVYDPGTDTWETKAPMPTVRNLLAAVAIDSKLYVVGGLNNSVYLNTLEVYDPGTDTWETKAPMPTARHSPVAAEIGGKLYVAGGYNGESLTTLEIYNPLTNIWETKMSQPSASGSGAAAAINGQLYVVGGWTGSYLGKLDVYNPGTNTWETKDPMPTARRDLATVAMDGKLYAVGGYNESYLNNLEVYDPGTDTWETKTGMPTARAFLAAVAINGKLYALGGDSEGTVSSKLEVYSTTDDPTLVFTQQPDLVRAGENIGTITVEIRNAADALVSSSNAPVTIALANNPSDVMLNGTLTVNAVNGIATFSDLSVSKSGVDYRLTASGNLLTEGTSGPFNISCQVITIGPAAGALPAGKVGSSYSQQFTQSGGIGTINWTLNTIIPGLTLNSNGLLSGTPLIAGPINFAVTAYDGSSCPGSAGFTLEIAKGDQIITFDPIQDRIFGTPPFPADAFVDSPLPISYSATGNCTVSGRGEVTLTGEGSCTITASQAGDDNYNPAAPVSQSFMITGGNICPTISLSPAKLPDGTIGVNYSVKITPVGGAGPYQITVGQLPGWMSAKITNSSVTISGQPTVTGIFIVVIKVRDRNDCTNARGDRLSFRIVKPRPDIVWNNPADIHCNTPLGPAQLNATANVAGTFSYLPPAGTILGFGQHPLSVTFTPDDTANWDPASKTVQLNVVPYPYITLKPGVSIDSNDHLYRTLKVEDMVAGVTDGCASLSINNAVIEKVTSDEADNIAGNTDGETTNDIVILPNCKSVQLRAERDDRGDGRVYNVTLRVTAGEGIGTRAVFQVQVPVRSGKPAVNGAVNVTKLSNCQP